jgi:hypothetical protein
MMTLDCRFKSALPKKEYKIPKETQDEEARD